jgi:hypothetical protein
MVTVRYWKCRLYWWSRGGSNSWPPHCERGALPTELLPHAKRILGSVKLSVKRSVSSLKQPTTVWLER